MILLTRKIDTPSSLESFETGGEESSAEVTVNEDNIQCFYEIDGGTLISLNYDSLLVTETPYTIRQLIREEEEWKHLKYGKVI